MKATQLFSVLLLALILSLTLVSAISFTDSNTALTLTQSDTSETLTVTTNDLANFTIVNANTANFSVTPALSNNVTSTVFTVLATSSIALGSHSYSFSITAVNATNSTDLVSKNITVTLTNNTNRLCSGSNPANIVVDDIEFNVVSGFGDEDDLFFYPMDKVEVSFNVENSGNWDVKNIEISACLFDKSSGKCIMDEGDMDITNDNLDLDSNDDDDVTLAFEIDPDQLKAGNNDYTLYLSANGEIDDSDAGTNDNAQSCAPASEDIKIRTDENFAIVSDISYTENLNCGDTLEVSANVWNVGDEDFADDEIYFEIYSKELGINKEFTFDSGIDSMEKENVFYSVKLPSNLSVKSYKLLLSVLDEDHDVLQNKEDDNSQTTVLVTVGSCVVSASASINASLSEETPQAKVGGEVIVNTVIKNTGASSATYTVSVPSIDFAEVSEIDPSTFTLAAGESKDVSIYLNINSNTKVGNKEFTIRAVSGQSVSEQKVKLAVQEGFSANGLVNHFRANWIVYLIILVNLILIIAIISVVVRIVNKSD